MAFAVGQRVQSSVNGQVGTVRFLGTTKFAEGLWVGLELDPPFPGKHNGEVNGEVYFACEGNRGVFVRPNTLRVVNASSPAPTKKTIGATAVARATVKTSTTRLSTSLSSPVAEPSPTGSDSPSTDSPSTLDSPLLAKKRISMIASSTARRQSSGISPSVISPATLKKTKMPVPSTISPSNSSRLSADSRSRRESALSGIASVSNSRRSSISSNFGGLKDSSIIDDIEAETPIETAIFEEEISDRSSSVVPSESELATEGSATSVNSVDVAHFMDTTNISDKIEPKSPDNTSSTTSVVYSMETSLKKIHVEEFQKKSETPAPVKFEIKSEVVQHVEAPPVIAATPIQLRRRLSAAGMSSAYGISSSLKIETASPGPSDSSHKSDSEELFKIEIATLKGNHNKQILELTAKIQHLESLRASANILQQSYDQLQLEHSTLQVSFSAHSDKHVALAETAKTQKAELDKERRQRADLEERVQMLEIDAEHAILDRECAEAENENLKEEMEIVKRSREDLEIEIDELKVEIEIARLEAKGDGAAEGGSEGVSNSDVALLTRENMKLQRHNEQLSEGLLRLRDIMYENETGLRVTIQELQREISDGGDLRVKMEKLETEIKLRDEQIALLNEQVDSSAAAMEIVSMLTDKTQNLHLERDRMRAEIENLSELVLVGDELEETHNENERELIAEIDFRDGLLRELVAKNDAQDEAIADRDNTIAQFRELVSRLQR
ncbi:hypothetical protein HK096_010847 [Nowakowskiella sp. JEL0078]|nr:hypothetical protein HK096_010847 [Nowakowskiella sp. JEL0078]